MPTIPGTVCAESQGRAIHGKICEQLYDLASLSHGPLAPERMTQFVSRSNEIMMIMAGEKTDSEKTE